jgi:hypothetical protein
MEGPWDAEDAGDADDWQDAQDGRDAADADDADDAEDAEDAGMAVGLSQDIVRYRWMTNPPLVSISMSFPA